MYRLSMPQDRLASCSEAHALPGCRTLVVDLRVLHGWTNALSKPSHVLSDQGRSARLCPILGFARQIQQQP